MKLLKTERMMQPRSTGNFIQDAITGNTSVPGDVYTPGAISVFARVVPNYTNTTYYVGHHHLSFISNTVNGCSLDGINVVSGGQEVFIEGNTLTNVNTRTNANLGIHYGLVSGQPITVQRSAAAKIENNTMEKVAVNWNSNAPVDQVLASYTNGPASSGVGWNHTNSAALGGRRDLGQSFQVSSNSTLDSFSLQAGGRVQLHANLAAFTVKLFESTNSTSIGSNILTQAGTYLNERLYPIIGGWLTFDIKDTSLQAGKIYTFILSWDGSPALTRTQVFNNNNAGTYPNGFRCISTNGVDYGFNPWSDLFFSVQGATQ